MEFHDLLVGVVDRERRPGIAISRLSDGTWVDEIASVGLQWVFDESVSNPQADRLSAWCVQHKAALHVRMAEEGDAGFHFWRDESGVHWSDEVVVFVERRAMNELHVAEPVVLHRARRHVGEPLAVHGREHVARPIRGDRSDGIELFGAHHSGTSLVVIAADVLSLERAHPIDNFVGRRPVADDITQVNDLIVRRSSLESGFQGFDVGMDIADEEKSHRGRWIIYLSLRVLSRGELLRLAARKRHTRVGFVRTAYRLHRNMSSTPNAGR